MDRRQTLGLLGALAATLTLEARTSRASTALAVSLKDLVSRSSRIAHATPLEGFSRFENIGDRRHIVTYSRLQVHELLRGPSGETEMLVRTLGGRVDNLGEIVHGEAVLALNEACVVFIHTTSDGIDQVTAMAQGHYPLTSDTDGTRRLTMSRAIPHLMGDPSGAATRLSGLKFEEARTLIRAVRP